MATDWAEQLSLFLNLKPCNRKKLDPSCIPLYRHQYFNISNRFMNFTSLENLPKIYTFNQLFDKNLVSPKNKPKQSKTVNGLVLKNKIPIPQACPCCQQASIASTMLLQSPKNANIPSASYRYTILVRLNCYHHLSFFLYTSKGHGSGLVTRQ